MLDKLKLKYSKRPIKGDKYSLRNLKVLTDEILLDYMRNCLNLRLNNLYTDFQLAVGILSTILASVLAYFSMNYEYEEYKTYLFYSVLLYFSLNGLVYICDFFRTTTFYFTEKTGEGKDTLNSSDIQIRVSTGVTPPNPVYTLLVYRNNKLIPEKWSKSVFDLFDNEGVMRSSEFLDEMNIFFNKK